MSPESIESSLKRLRPAALDESLLARLEACAAVDANEPTAAEQAFEANLRVYTPAPLPQHLLNSLEAAIANPETVSNDDKIVEFPTSQRTTTRTSGWWSAAAAVALAGALAAFVIPFESQTSPEVANAQPEAKPAPPTPPREELVPAGFNRGLGGTSDEGVIWHSNHQAHRVLKVTYLDRITLKAANGLTYQIEQPRTEYILVPAKTD